MQKTDPDVAAALTNRLDQMRRHQPDMTVRDWRDQMTRLETLARDGTARGRALALLQGRSAAEQDFVARTRSGTDRVAGGAAGHAQTIAQAHLARAGYSRPPDGEALQNSIRWLEQNHPDIATRHAQAIDTAQGPEVNPADPAATSQLLDDARDLHTLETDLIRAEAEGTDGDGRDDSNPDLTRADAEGTDGDGRDNNDPDPEPNPDGEENSNPERKDPDPLSDFEDILPRPDLPSVFVDTTRSEKGTPEYEMLNNPQPNTRYVLDKGTVFITNDHGYVDAISYQPVLNKQKRDSRQTKVGKEGLPDDVGGNIQVWAMDSTGDRFNLFPQNAKFNNSEYRSWEHQILKALREEGRTMGRVTTRLRRKDETSARPDILKIQYEMDGEMRRISFKNEEGAGKNGIRK